MAKMHYEKLSAKMQKQAKVLKLIAEIMELNGLSKSARNYYEAAALQNPDDTESIMKAFTLYTVEQKELFEKNKGKLSSDQVRKTFYTFMNRILEISSNPKFDLKLRIKTMSTGEFLLASNVIEEKFGLEYWKLYSNLDPSYQKPKESLIALYYKKAQYMNAMSYLKKLSDMNKLDLKNLDRTVEIIEKSSAHEDGLKMFQKLLNQNPKDSRVWGYLGIYQYKLGLEDQAQKSFQRSESLGNKDTTITKAHARALENSGDKASKNKNWIQAMSYYSAATDKNPQSYSLRKKLARLIASYLKSTDLKPGSDAAKKDADFALSKVKSIQNKTFEDLGTITNLAVYSSKPSLYQNACDKIKFRRSTSINLTLTENCVYIYQSSKNTSKARAFVTTAVKGLRSDSDKAAARRLIQL